MYRVIATASALIAAARAQQVCSLTTETKPALTWSKCTSSGCSDVKGSVGIDANWRWTHQTSGSTNCYTGNKWDTSICTDGKTCAEKCCLDGADYAGTYGITSSGNQLSLGFVTQGPYSKNIGSRTYLMENENTYQMFQLLGNEFTFDVDVSGIGCGLNGALYFVSMDEDGGKAKYSGNKAGAKYGTGYCDAQCPRDVKFINGVVSINLEYDCRFGTDANQYSRPTLKAGSPLTVMLTLVLVTWALAVPRWISGRPTPSPPPSLLILAPSSLSTLALATLAVEPTLMTDMAVLAMPTVVISTPTARATRPSTALDPTSTSIPPRR